MRQLTFGQMEAHERTDQLAASPPLFKSEFLNYFSRVHPVIPAIIFVPVILAAEVIGATKGWNAWQMILISAAGLAFWTLTEYWLHRLVFHWEPDNAFGHRMHFIIHGIHHDHPNDKMRLVMPPSVSIPLAALFFGAFWLIFGNAVAMAAELHVHPQTARYRVARLRELFGEDLDHPDARFELEIALRASR